VSDVKVERIEPADKTILEEWSRVTEEPELLGVGALRSAHGEWTWQVHIPAMEFIRTEPLESEFEAAISAALAGVPVVSEAAHEDRETWVIKGNADGPSLVRAAAAVVDRFSSRIREDLEA
jgi:hypothetical protein